jgi:hypothetical protein
LERLSETRLDRHAEVSKDVENIDRMYPVINVS